MIACGSSVLIRAVGSALRPLLDRELVKTFVSLGNGLVQERIAGIVDEGNLINSRVVELVHAMEGGERRPGRDVFGELRSLSG